MALSTRSNERSRFDYRIQGPTETISEYNVALHAMALHCNFADTLTTRLRDCLVSGLRSETIRKSLYTKKELTYKDALDTALAIELASKEATPSTPSNVSTHYSGSKATPQPQLQQQSRNGKGRRRFPAKQPRSTPQSFHESACLRTVRGSCLSCGSNKHARVDCPLKDAVCDGCSKKGHIKPVCMSGTSRPPQPARAHHVQQQIPFLPSSVLFQ
uniref:CCHC-type domain-containing protein n=1 Tax=Strigamia maritima TaxID=126957 RepID=T1ISP5_STRMM